MRHAYGSVDDVPDLSQSATKGTDCGPLSGPSAYFSCFGTGVMDSLNVAAHDPSLGLHATRSSVTSRLRFLLPD